MLGCRVSCGHFVLRSLACDQSRLANLTHYCLAAFQDGQGLTTLDRMSKFYTYLTGYYYSTMQQEVSELLNDLLLSVFGVSDVTASENVQNNFEEYYFASSRCAAFVLRRLEELQEAFRDKYTYEAQETGITSLSPGSSDSAALYIIFERHPMYIPFDWFWQCAVLGGAVRFWHQTFSLKVPDCDVFSQQRTEDGNVYGLQYKASVRVM